MALFGAKCQKLFEDNDTVTSLDVQCFFIKLFKQSWPIIKLLNLNTVKREQFTHICININKFGRDWSACIPFISIAWTTMPHT